MKKKCWKLLVLSLALVFLLSGCGEKIVAKVNGEKITESQLNTKVEQIAALNGYDLEGENGELVKGFLQEQMLQALIMEKLVIQDAETRKIPFDNKILEAEMNNFKASFSSQQEYQEFLTANKLEEKDMKNIYKNMLIYNALFNEVTKDITESSKDPEEYYNEHSEEFDQPEMVQVRHILVETEEEAKEVLTLLAEGGDFKELALERSTDPSVKQNEGLMEYFPQGGYMVPEFEEASFALKEIGEITPEPVKTDYGYHLIKLEGREEAKHLSFEEVKDSLVERFLAEEKNAKFQVYEEELLANAEIENLLLENEEEENGEEQGEPEGQEQEGQEENEENVEGQEQEQEQQK